jgi:YbbR domain-containing protein
MIRDLLLKDWGWKMFSLLLAAAIWLTVHRILEPENALLAGRTSTLTFDTLTVQPVSSTSDVRFYRVEPAVVRVTVSGPPEVMNLLQQSQVEAEVNLSGAVGATAPVDIITPPNVTLVAVEPQTVSILAPAKP